MLVGRCFPNVFFTGLTQIVQKGDIFHQKRCYFSNLTP